MPQYIEFNKESLFPSASLGKDVMGINSTGNLVINNSSNVESVIGYINPINHKTYVAKLTQQNEGTLTSGILTVGKTYLIEDYISYDDFSNVADVQSGTINTTGCIFIATGTTPTVWGNGSGIRDKRYPLPSIAENTLDFIPYWKYLTGGVYYFNFPSTTSVDYNKLTARFTPTSTDNVFSTIAINPSDYSFWDSSFYPNANATGFDAAVLTTAIQTDGKIICGGTFGGFDGTSSPHLARLNSDGTLDNTFSIPGTGFSGDVLTTSIQSDGKIVCGGEFGAFNETPNFHIARLDEFGSLDTEFNTNAGSGFSDVIRAIAIQTDGKIICGGNSLSDYNGIAVNGICRLNTDGTLDTTFNFEGTGLDNKQAILSIAIQTDGKILCGGQFVSYNGSEVARNIMRLNTDGTLDTTFNTNAGTGFTNDRVNSVAIQSDGKILCGGIFGFVNGNDAFNIARLNADGTYDPTFNSGGGFTGGVNTITLDTADNAFIGGSFIYYNSISSNSIIRLNNSGSILNTFGTGFVDGEIYTISQQADSKIVVGGGFIDYDGNSNLYITRLYGSYDVVVTSTDYTFTTANDLLLNNPVEIKLYD